MHLVSTEPNLTEFLLNLVAQSRDRLPDTLFPLKKVYIVMQYSYNMLFKQVFIILLGSTTIMEVSIVHVRRTSEYKVNFYD